MSLPQAAEQSITYADFLALITDPGRFRDIRWGPAYASGTRVLANLKSGVWKAFLISDLTAPKRNTFTFVRSVGGAFTTASLTAVSTGNGLPAGIVLNQTGRLVCFLSGDGATDTAGDGFVPGVYFNTTGVPVAGTGVGSDTVITNAIYLNIPGPNLTVPFARIAIKTGIALNTTIFPYLSLAAVGGGTASIKASAVVQVAMIEI